MNVCFWMEFSHWMISWPRQSCPPEHNATQCWETTKRTMDNNYYHWACKFSLWPKGAFINTKLYQRMASVHNWLTELNNWLNELKMKGLDENFSSTESKNSFFTRSHHVVEEISSCENFSHSRPSCGTLRNSISRTTGVMFIIFEAHQLVLWHIMRTNIIQHLNYTSKNLQRVSKYVVANN